MLLSSFDWDFDWREDPGMYCRYVEAEQQVGRLIDGMGDRMPRALLEDLLDCASEIVESGDFMDWAGESFEEVLAHELADRVRTWRAHDRTGRRLPQVAPVRRRTHARPRGRRPGRRRRSASRSSGGGDSDEGEPASGRRHDDLAGRRAAWTAPLALGAA